jgi:hypothetical protein
MKKSELIAKLEGAKELTSVVSIDLVLAALGMLEPEIKVEKVFGMSQELADEISAKIERCLENNSNCLVDTDSASFSLNYNNCIELDEACIDTYSTMEHINAVLEGFIVEEEDEEDEEEGMEDVLTDEEAEGADFPEEISESDIEE